MYNNEKEGNPFCCCLTQLNIQYKGRIYLHNFLIKLPPKKNIKRVKRGKSFFGLFIMPFAMLQKIICLFQTLNDKILSSSHTFFYENRSFLFFQVRYLFFMKSKIGRIHFCSVTRVKRPFGNCSNLQNILRYFVNFFQVLIIQYCTITIYNTCFQVERNISILFYFFCPRFFFLAFLF